MALVRWKPFGDLFSIHDRINKLFEDEFYKSSEKGLDSLASWYPVADIYETKDNYVFKMELPGLSKEDVDIELSDNLLTIKGEKKEEKEVKKEDFHRIERFSGKFKRTFTIPKDIDSKKISASMKDGIMEVRIPKAEQKKTKAIPINIK